ncbi:inositol 1,4,5-triphosphate receptor associated 2 isoform X3 [Astyanax mexicanus]|uniref:inositol 1,4,5-triphosphate receptor associated 2 isoform X3 n=1 Tax=Astyanax mexicanus TaxID=7994 RepID=UPI0020CAF9E3|nr:inositol 1,4,5-triphosphate receptor associated 2 isoform X3 [Astyanax mexicanus]
MDVGVTPRRHNPVDSICRKLQTIQRRDQEANSPFQIPKLQSSSYDSPHTGLRRNLEAILKKRGVRGDGDSDHETSSVMLTPTGTPATRLPTRSTPTHSVPFTPANATYSITSTLGTLAERGSMAPGYTRPWQRSCSTPAVQRSGDGFINFTPRCPLPVQPQVEKEKSSAPPHGLLTYNLNFCSSDTSNIGDSELAYPALVVKRLSLGDGGLFTSESKKESMAEVSLICEEDLLDTIFQACDTQCRGKVYVSHIVDYLRHTTSRSSEDSGLEELCNMLDPEHKDISIDLDTYHAIMKEWIEDCRNQGKDSKEDLTQESVKLLDNLSAAKRSFLLNMTSGSLEAFGGEASRADLETSDLVFCVADLQFNNQKLQEEVRKLKQTVEGMEETNQKLIEENEELKTQAKMGQQLLQKERMLKEEVEEMKLSLSSSEEIRARASAQSKHMERENQNLIMKISSLQEENLKVSMEVDELQKKMRKLYELNTDLQVQIHSFDAVMAEKVSVIQEKTRQTEELKAAVMEYSSVIELLRAEKSKLESQMQLMQPDMTIPGISLSVAYTLNQTSSGSLETELALAQHHPLEGADNFSSSICLASPLDETLDREVLLLLQGPTPEQMSLEFKALINRLRKEFEEDSLAVITSLRGLTKSQETQDNSSDLKVQDLRVQLQRRRGDWVQGLEQLKQYTDSLEKELLKMASNMRRSRTEILHLSVRVQEQENQKQHLREELDQLKTPQDSREASSQTPDDVQQVVEDLDGSSLDWVEKRTLPTSPIREEDPAVLEPKEDQKSERDPDPEGEEIRDFRETDKVEEGVCGEVEKRGLSREREATHDSGVETDELGGSTLLQKGLPDCMTNGEPGESCENLLSGEREELQEHGGAGHEEARLPECTGPEDTHGQAVCCEASESTSLLHSHTLCADEPDLNSVESVPTAQPRDQEPSSQDPTPPKDSEMGPPTPDQPEQSTEELVSLLQRSPEGTVVSEGREGRREGEQDITTSMSSSQKLTQEQLSDVPSVLDRSCLLPVAEEEEAMPEAGQQVASAEKDSTTSEEAGSVPGSDSAVTAAESTEAHSPESSPQKDHPPPDSSKDGSPTSASKKDPLALRSRFKRDLEMSRSMEAIEEQKTQEESEASVTTEKEGDVSVVSEDASDSTKDESNSLSPSDKEIETEFHRLSLGYKCDMFTLEKRFRLEERSRDLAEENVRREVSSCQGLLQALIPLCEDDNQSMEIIQRLQKNLDILIQSMTRVSSRSEMLGSIHQESRTGKAVEVMIQHVENLRRTYTKEHAELMELRETLMQNERSFGSHTERDDFRNKKQPNSQYYKPAPRRVSLGIIPRPLHFDMNKDGTETEAERLSRRSPWNVVGKSVQRPPLKRFISSGGWAETDGPALINRFAYDSDSHSEGEQKEKPKEERKSSLTELGNKITSLIMPAKTPNNPSPTEQTPPCLVETRSAVVTRSLWVWLAMLVILAALLALLASLVMQPAVDAAPVGTGDSWMTIQQLLWPYTGLRHNGQPPV